MDTSDFDHPDKEGPDTIVYAPLRAPQHDSLSGACEVRPIIAATINKLIEKLTHQHGMDSGFMADFFLTYRLFMSPVQLCKDLIRRYLWALEEDTESRCVVRVRTFVVFRYWINNHFTDDFLTSQSLRFQMGSFLNGMCFNPRIQASARDSRIIRNLAGLFKQHRKYYKDLAERILARERQVERQQSDGEEVEGHPNATTANTVGVGEPTLQAEDVEASSIDVESLGGSTDQRDALVEQWPEGVTNSDACSVPMTRIKGRNRALTLAGTTTRSMIAEAQRYQSSSKPSLTRESRVSTMSRQTSEGGTVITRERRLSASSIKSSKGGSTWSSKMTMGINKLRQKSEDIYQQLIHPATVAFKHGDSRSCLCWTPEYTGITEHHALSTARSYPCLRPSVIVTSVPAPQDLTPFSQPSSAAVSSSTALAMTSTGPSNRSIKRLKSPINLNPSSSTAVTSPGPSPTRNQFSSLSSRHSRSNSNSSMSYHPNPNCPYHVPCQSTVNEDAIPKQSQEAADEEDTLATLKEALQDAFVEMAESLIRQEQHEQEQQQQPAVPSLPTTIPPSPAWGYYPFYAMMQHSNNSSAAATPSAPLYKPFILYYRSQMIAQQLCLLEQHFLEQVRWDELLELELARAGRKNKGRSPPSISGYRFKAESERNGIEASNERSNRLCMWVASEIVSTPAIEDRVRVIEKFIRIAQKCYQYRNYNSLIQLVMGLGSWQLCGLRRTWSKVSSFEMRVLQELQDFISPCSNWKVIRKAMNQASDQKAAPTMEAGQRLSMQGLDNMLGASNSLATESTCSATHSINDPPNSNNSNGHANTSASVHSSKYLHHPLPLDKQGCIPFLGLFVFDLTHIAVSPSWYLPQAPIDSSENQYQDNGYDYVLNDFAGTGCSGGSSTSVPPTPMGVSQLAMAAQLQAPEPKDLQELLPTGTLLVHFHRFQLIAKTIKWFLAFQRNSQRYTFSVDSTLYSKCFLLRVLSENRIRELAQSYEQECVPP
ncbi:hypothetical protein EDD11_006831 [Mortierella claussenii]|nr:hypothetical protein EDD11_006831 [Mortierella claussenii]